MAPGDAGPSVLEWRPRRHPSPPVRAKGPRRASRAGSKGPTSHSPRVAPAHPTPAAPFGSGTFGSGRGRVPRARVARRARWRVGPRPIFAPETGKRGGGPECPRAQPSGRDPSGQRSAPGPGETREPGAQPPRGPAGPEDDDKEGPAGTPRLGGPRRLPEGRGTGATGAKSAGTGRADHRGAATGAVRRPEGGERLASLSARVSGSVSARRAARRTGTPILGARRRSAFCPKRSKL